MCKSANWFFEEVEVHGRVHSACQSLSLELEQLTGAQLVLFSIVDWELSPSSQDQAKSTSTDAARIFCMWMGLPHRDGLIFHNENSWKLPRGLVVAMTLAAQGR